MLWFGHDSTMAGENWILHILNAHSTNISTLEFSHEKSTLTYTSSLLKVVSPFVRAPLFKIFSAPLVFHSQNFPAPPPLKKGGGKNYGGLALWKNN